jgi:hypothetical protein
MTVAGGFESTVNTLPSVRRGEKALFSDGELTIAK